MYRYYNILGFENMWPIINLLETFSFQILSKKTISKSKLCKKVAGINWHWDGILFLEWKLL